MGRHLALTLRLYFRNRLALVYGYVFPVVYFVAFYVLYRFERTSVARHMGELLTVTILASACFGLPTSLVSEREQGVWRRYRLAPIPMRHLLVSTAVARYVLLLTAGLLQLALAAAVGAPAPSQPLQLLAIYSIACFTFVGFGMVVAMVADNVPAVQALGQCIFLPMLIIGGVAVQMSSLPAWAQHFAGFLPGRYSVIAIQSSMSEPALPAVGFAIGALIVIGGGAYLTAAKLFRWDAHQRFAAGPNKRWLMLGVSACIAVGLAGEWQNRAAAQARAQATVGSLPTPVPSAPPRMADTAAVQPPVAPTPPLAEQPTALQPTTRTPTVPASGRATPTPRAVQPAATPTWRSITTDDIAAGIDFIRLPPDTSVVTPIAPPGDAPDEFVAEELATIRSALPTWEPGLVDDPVQRVRNLLYVPAVVDVFQMPMEAYVPRLVFDVIQARVSRDELVKIAAWIALRPDEGDDSAIAALEPLGVSTGPPNAFEARDRVRIYAVKLLGRLTGRFQAP